MASTPASPPLGDESANKGEVVDKEEDTKKEPSEEEEPMEEEDPDEQPMEEEDPKERLSEGEEEPIDEEDPEEDPEEGVEFIKEDNLEEVPEDLRDERGELETKRDEPKVKMIA